MERAPSAEAIKLDEAFELAELQLQNGMPDAAVKTFREALRASAELVSGASKSPGNKDGPDVLQLKGKGVSGKLRLAGALLGCGDQLVEALTEVEQALITFRTLNAEVGMSIDHRYCAALTEESAGLLDKMALRAPQNGSEELICRAKAVLQLVIDDSTDMLDESFRCIRLLLRNGKTDQALSAGRTLTAEFPNAFEKSSAMQTMGIVLAHSGKFAEAVPLFESAMIIAASKNIEPVALVELYVNFAHVLASVAQTDRAVEVSERALAMTRSLNNDQMSDANEMLLPRADLNPDLAEVYQMRDMAVDEAERLEKMVSKMCRLLKQDQTDAALSVACRNGWPSSRGRPPP